MGLAPQKFDYEMLNKAFRIISGETPSEGKSKKTTVKAPLLTTHRAKYFAAPDGALSLGPGPFVAALETATGVKAESVGKPSKEFFETVISDFSRAEQTKSSSDGRIAIVGDDVEGDLGEGAIDLGLWRVLGELLYQHMFFVMRECLTAIDSQDWKVSDGR